MVHFRIIFSLWCKARISAKPFAVAAPDLWNSLPNNIRALDYLSSFKSDLKASLFSEKRIMVNCKLLLEISTEDDDHTFLKLFLFK